MYAAPPSEYLLNPFSPLYENNDLEISKDNAIAELIEYAIGLEKQIEGDFNLDYVRFEFRYNELAFVRNGLLAFKVQSLRLYKKYYSNFKLYCKEVLKLSYWQVKKIIESSRVVMELIHAGFAILPRNISQAEQLAELSGDELTERWQEIIDNIPEHLITAKSINNFLNPPERYEKVETVIKVPPKLYLDILKVALERNLSVVQLLEVVLKKVDTLLPLRSSPKSKKRTSRRKKPSGFSPKTK